MLVLEMAMRGLRPDRRALRDRRARRRRDHQRRAGPPRAARDARGDRRGEGRDPRRARRRRARRRSRPTPRRSSRTCADELETITFGPGGDVFAREQRARGRRPARRDRHPAAARRSSSSRSPRRTTSPTPPARSRSGSRSARPVGEMARRAPGISFSRLRGELIRAARGLGAGQRLLQRQPDLDARGARPPRLARAPTGGGSRCSAGWRELGPDGPGYHREAGAHARELGIDAIVGVGELARDYAPDEWAADPDAAVDRSSRAARRRRRDPGQGLALGRARGVHRGAPGPGRRRLSLLAAQVEIGEIASTRDRPRRGADRRDGGDADHDLPRPEVHRVPAGARSSVSRSARRARRSTTRRPARRRWAG